jgi:hypothetical protein
VKRNYLLAFLLLSVFNVFASKDNRVYEMRIYYCEPGRLENLVQRFTNHTTKLFEKHGMVNEGYWLPTKNDSNALYYVLSYPSMEAREKSWQTFKEDPKWIAAKEASEVDGKIVSKVKSYFMTATDYSMSIKKSRKKKSGVYELRIYHLNPGKLMDINNRFANYTIKSFESFGMRNIVYWNTIEKDANIQPILIYLLGHNSEAAAKKSFDDFIADPERIRVFNKSEENGKIISKIESVFLQPLAISKLK